MRRLDDTLPGYAGIGQGRTTAIVCADAGVFSGQAFAVNALLTETDAPAENRAFGLGAVRSHSHAI